MPSTASSLPVKNLLSLLRQKLGNDITIVDVNWKNLTDPGENYGSFIIAVNVTVAANSRTETHNLVVKLPPSSAWLQQLFNSPFTFVKELQFYRELTPELLAIQRENGLPEPEKTWLGADYYGGRVGLSETEEFDDQAAIVLQNLNFTGYKTVDRMLGLTRTQAELGVRQLAKLHATPIALRMQKPEVFETKILPALGQPANEIAKSCVMDMVKKAMEDLENIAEAGAYRTSVAATMEYIASMEHSGANEIKDQWATIVHNDFWINNMMFKNDDSGNIVDMKIVDFQLCIYDYGVKDLIFFLISSPTNEVIDNDFDKLVDLYHSSFVKTLESMKIDAGAFPKQQLVDRLNECAPLKFGQCLMMNQVIKSKPGAAPKMEDIDSKESFLTIGGGEVYQQKMLHTVQFFDKRGWLKK